MKRRQFLLTGVAAGISGLSGCATVGDFAKDTYRKVTNSPLPASIPDISPEERAQRRRYSDTSSPLNNDVKRYWEYASDVSGTFQPHTARVREGTLYTGFSEEKDEDEPSYLKSGELHAINARTGAKKWSTNAVVHDIAVPDGDYLYMSSSIAASEPPDRWRRITKVDKETGEKEGILHEEKSSDKLTGLLIVDDILVVNQRDHVFALPISGGEELWRVAGVDGYAISNSTIYIISDGLKAYNLETGDRKWSWADASGSPLDPDFGQPRIHDGLILVRDTNDNTVYAYNSEGDIVRQFVIEDNLAGAPIFSPNTVYAPYREEDTMEGKIAGVTKYNVTEDGDLQKDWEYTESARHLHYGFQNGLVMCDDGLVDKEGVTALAIPVPGFIAEDGRNRFMKPNTVRGYEIGLVFSNAVFTFGDTIRAYAPA